MFGKKGSMLTCDNTIWCIKIKGQKKPRETFKETSRSLIQEWVDKWPSSMLTRWRRWWCGAVMAFDTLRVTVRILHFSINSLNIYCIFPYTQQPLLLASQKPTRLLFLNPKQWNILNPHIMYVLCVHLYRSAISANLFLHRKYTSKSMGIQTMREKIKFHILRTWTSTQCPLTPHANILLYWKFILVTCFDNAK